MNQTDLKILELKGQGLTTKEIAAALNMSPRTVEGRISRMLKLNGCKSTTQLVKKMAEVNESA